MSRLYTPTDQTDQDGLHAEWGPFDNPANVNPPRVLHWHYWKSARAYHPFLVEVADVSEGEITFWILDRDTGARLHVEPIVEKLNHVERLWNQMPSTAQLVDPGSKDKRCGFLFLSASYTRTIVRMGIMDEPTMATYRLDGKWPHGEYGTGLVESLITGLDDHVLSAEKKQSIIKILKSSK
jgi:hypothetical protein